MAEVCHSLSLFNDSTAYLRDMSLRERRRIASVDELAVVDSDSGRGGTLLWDVADRPQRRFSGKSLASLATAGRAECLVGQEGDTLATAKLLRGAPVARRVRLEVQTASRGLADEFATQPALATVMIGHAGPSVAYHEAIARSMSGCGIRHEDVLLPVAATTARVVETIERLNERPDIHGILVLLPLPSHIHALEVISAIAPEKDIDGISPTSVGRLHLGLPALYPSTPQAGLEILDYYQIPVSGKRAVVIGRGNVVGKPMAALLTARDATVTLCHSRTLHLDVETRSAELVVLAAGSPGLLTGGMLAPGATVIDFGVNVAGGRVFGDADAKSVVAVAGAYTPVPGGTTPVTTMVLARNTATAAFAQVTQHAERAVLDEAEDAL